MRAYAAANIYDTDEQSAMDALLETAAQAIDSAATVAAVAKLRQVYMGTENIDGELAGIKTYPAKAADELYNKYIFDRSYAPEDMAKALRAYEGWKLKLFSAPDLDGVEAVYADARKAMDALTRDFTTGDTAPDMDTAASAARALARQEVLDSLAMLEQGYIDALTAIAGDMDALSYAWKARLTAVLDSGKAALHAAATPALEDIDDYGHRQAGSVGHLRRRLCPADGPGRLRRQRERLERHHCRAREGRQRRLSDRHRRGAGLAGRGDQQFLQQLSELQRRADGGHRLGLPPLDAHRLLCRLAEQPPLPRRL